MVRVLITGFKHSGTTLLHQLLNAHPDVDRIENEAGYIELKNAKEWVLSQASNKHFVWGDKLPWSTRKNDLKAQRAIAFSKKWLRIFQKKGRVLHLVRHPVDVSLSRYPLMLEQNLTLDKNTYRYATTSVPIFIDHVNNSLKMKTIVYEELVVDPELHLKNILAFLNLKNNPKLIKKIIESKTLRYGKINPDRAYAFKQKGITSDYDYNKLIERITNRL
jgi:hypothetical protein